MVKNRTSFCNTLVSKREWCTVANALSLLRAVLSIPLVLAIRASCWRTALYLTIVAGISDALDGYIARASGTMTVLGRLLDPIADKCLLLSSIAALVYHQGLALGIPVWFFGLLVMREIILLVGGGLLLAGSRERTHDQLAVAPTVLGKMTTLLQLLFISWLFMCYVHEWTPTRTFFVVCWLLAGLVVISLMHYVYIGVRRALKLV